MLAATCRRAWRPRPSRLGIAVTTAHWRTDTGTTDQAASRSRPWRATARQAATSVATGAPRRSFSALKKAEDAAGGPRAAATPAEQTRAFLASLNYSEAVSEGIINALLQNGIPPSSLLTMVKGLAGRYEVDEDAGLQALAASVQVELDKVQGKEKVTLRCVPASGWSPGPDAAAHGDEDAEHRPPVVTSPERSFVVEAAEGTTLTDVAKFGTSDNCAVLGEYIECACAGIMACSTCHVVVHPDWYDATAVPGSGSGDESNQQGKVGPPSEAEQDMLDLAYEPQATSRLGCQIRLTRDLDGLTILLPGGSHNLMDHVPFE